MEVAVNKISDAEWEVMRVVWTKQAATSQEIIEVLQNKMMWKPVTVKTLIGRLVKKEMLATTADGKRFIYRPLVSEDETVKSATESLFAHICSTKIGKTIAELVDEATLTQNDIDLIRAALQSKVPVARIQCNCIPGQCECSEHADCDH